MACLDSLPPEVRVFFLLIAVAGVGALMLGLGLLQGLASMNFGPVQRMGLDDATTLLHVVWALGAACFALWAPRSRQSWLVSMSVRYRTAGRVVASMLTLYALYWGGYFIERQVDDSLHRASPLTLMVAAAGALALYALDKRAPG